MCKQVKIFIDGSCIGNPGPGGYSATLYYGKCKKIFSGNYCLTTNNRMELMAAVVALKSLTGKYNVILNTDSQYVFKGITQWIHNWKKYDWKSSKNKVVKNIDLWKQLDAATKFHILCWNWIKGHSGNYENEYCDKLARIEANNATFKKNIYKNVDSNY